ncbi:MAG: hypothetical protein GY909_15485 [Oligoflexia bacterium]|nr:hypothetical protein [Oligoflexia bacterium]
MAIKISHSLYDELSNSYQGICKSCKCVQGSTEPDACNYECESCGKNEVFGLEELVLQGDLYIVDFLEEEEINY